MLNLAFEIGFDHYRFKLPLDIAKFQDVYRTEIRNGFEAARIQRVSQKKPDRFEKKLLGIRDRALIKGINVSLTAEDIRRELTKTGDSCPVTGIAFTFAENEATDWSVDRVDNDQGYSPDNIVIVSVVANQAKSNLDLSGLIKSALAPHDPEKELLSSRNWFRMAQFYYKKMHLNKPLHFCQLLGNTPSLYDQLIFLQLFHHKNRKSQIFLRHLEKYSSRETVRKAAKLAGKRIYHRGDFDVDVLYDSPKLYHSVQSFIQVINAHSKEFDPLLMNCLFA